MDITEITTPVRAPNGRFLAGHKSLPGAGRVAGYRQKYKEMAQSLVTAGDVRAAYRLMWTHIKNGDREMLKFFFNFFIGELEPTKLEIVNIESTRSPEELRQEFLDLVASSNSALKND